MPTSTFARRLARTASFMFIFLASLIMSPRAAASAIPAGEEFRVTSFAGYIPDCTGSRQGCCGRGRQLRRYMEL